MPEEETTFRVSITEETGDLQNSFGSLEKPNEDKTHRY